MYRISSKSVCNFSNLVHKNPLTHNITSFVDSLRWKE